MEIYYWKDETGKEVDFVVKNWNVPIRLIQVSTDVSDPETLQRERSGLISAMEHFGVEEGTIITEDRFDEETISGKKITFVPLWFWLLKEEITYQDTGVSA